MRKFAPVLFVSLALAWPAKSQTAVPAATATNSLPLITIAAADAAKHYGEKLIVTGQVAQVMVRPAVVILSLDKPLTNSVFTAVVFSRATNKFDNLTNLLGDDVAIQGTVKPYRGKPEIIMDTSNQLTVVKALAKP